MEKQKSTQFFLKQNQRKRKRQISNSVKGKAAPAQQIKSVHQNEFYIYCSSSVISLEMAGRHLEKFPILWIGELIIKNVRTMVKLTYVSGDMRVAINALPRSEPVPAIILCRRLRTNINEDFCYQKTNSCVLTAQPHGDTEQEMNRHASALHFGVVEYLKRKKATGAAAFSKDAEQYKLHFYLKSESSSSILATLAPDWFHLICDRMYLIMLVFE
ncbi:unnamed protein product [Larinioides sclopetarius]|uniref:SPOC domain-containing protein n=1 Tax=Larinioides sclopetarius TaxID=280406 RepID=A0AAV1Z908_9ARAC